MDRETKAIEEAKSRGKIFIENGWTEHEVEIFVKGFVGRRFGLEYRSGISSTGRYST